MYIIISTKLHTVYYRHVMYYGQKEVRYARNDSKRFLLLEFVRLVEKVEKEIYFCRYRVNVVNWSRFVIYFDDGELLARSFCAFQLSP